MEFRPLVLTLISAEDLIRKNSINLQEISKKGVYAVATISDSKGYMYYHKHKTSAIHKADGGGNLTWNSPTTFNIEEAAGLKNRLTLVIKIKAVRSFFLWDKTLCKVKVPIKALLHNNNNGVTTHQAEGKADDDIMHNDNVFSCQILSGTPNEGVLKFSYKFGKKYIKHVYNPRRSVASTSTSTSTLTSGGGFGTGYVTGMVLGGIASPGHGHHHHHGGGGGGCGSGGHHHHGGCGGGGGGCGGGS